MFEIVLGTGLTISFTTILGFFIWYLKNKRDFKKLLKKMGKSVNEHSQKLVKKIQKLLRKWRGVLRIELEYAFLELLSAINPVKAVNSFIDKVEDLITAQINLVKKENGEKKETG